MAPHASIDLAGLQGDESPRVDVCYADDAGGQRHAMLRIGPDQRGTYQVVPVTTDEPVIIGRSNKFPALEVQGTVSRQHLRFLLDNNGNVMAEDMGSTNGSRITYGSRELQADKEHEQAATAVHSRLGVAATGGESIVDGQQHETAVEHETDAEGYSNKINNKDSQQKASVSTGFNDSPNSAPGPAQAATESAPSDAESQQPDAKPSYEQVQNANAAVMGHLMSSDDSLRQALGALGKPDDFSELLTALDGPYDADQLRTQLQSMVNAYKDIQSKIVDRSAGNDVMEAIRQATSSSELTGLFKDIVNLAAVLRAPISQAREVAARAVDINRVLRGDMQMRQLKGSTQNMVQDFVTTAVGSAMRSLDLLGPASSNVTNVVNKLDIDQSRLKSALTAATEKRSNDLHKINQEINNLSANLLVNMRDAWGNAAGNKPDGLVTVSEFAAGLPQPKGVTFSTAEGIARVLMHRSNGSAGLALDNQTSITSIAKAINQANIAREAASKFSREVSLTNGYVNRSDLNAITVNFGEMTHTFSQLKSRLEDMANCLKAIVNFDTQA